MWCNSFGLQQGGGAILLDLNKGVVQYCGLKQGCGAIFWLKKECGAILLDLTKGVVQYFWT